VGGCRASTWDARILVRPSCEIAPDDARPIQKNPALPAKPAVEPAAKPVAKAAPAKPRISPDEQRAREAADQEAKRIRIAALAKDADALKISLIDRYPHTCSLPKRQSHWRVASTGFCRNRPGHRCRC
jgi:hypothetical protein